MAVWLRVGQAARLLNVSVDTLRAWERRGRIRARRTRGGHRRFALLEVRAISARVRVSRPSAAQVRRSSSAEVGSGPPRRASMVERKPLHEDLARVLRELGMDES